MGDKKNERESDRVSERERERGREGGCRVESAGGCLVSVALLVQLGVEVCRVRLQHPHLIRGHA